MTYLQEIDSVEILVIIDNELDPITPSQTPLVTQTGGLKEIALLNGAPITPSHSRGVHCSKELRMDRICCSAHGLSLLITAVKGGERRSILFDAGPEEWIFEMNSSRLRADLGGVEAVKLSHWHRDHSGGLPKALRMIKAAAAAGEEKKGAAVVVDLHPDRPDYRGMMAMEPVSLEADPTFEELEEAGGKVVKNAEAHGLCDGMFVVSGEIPRKTAYEVGVRRGIRFVKEKGEWVDDTLILDERFLMCKLKEKGLVVFTGCSHAGVVNASRHAMALGDNTPLYAVMGGFHLADAETETITSTVSDLKALEPKVLLTGHCTGWRAKFELEKAMPGRLVPSFVGCKFVL